MIVLNINIRSCQKIVSMHFKKLFTIIGGGFSDDFTHHCPENKIG